MKHYPKNPRKITQAQFERLEDSLSSLGDLSGVIHDLNSDYIIGGNQRGDVFDLESCEIQLVETYDKPDSQGTVAHGFIIWKNAKYAYRQVRWSEKQCEQANIIANKGGGDWDYEALTNSFEDEDLVAWGFSPWELTDNSAYQPTLEPSMGMVNHTSSDMEKAKERLERKFDGRPETIEVTCPHCAESFFIARSEL